jgi:hypothetical protein
MASAALKGTNIMRKLFSETIAIIMKGTNDPNTRKSCGALDLS